MARIELRQIEKRWGDVVAVEPTDLVIDDGEFVAVLGPSGCGKSTTLFMLAGIYAPTGGDILFGDEVVNDVEAKDRNVGIVFQSYALYPHMSVEQNILFPLKFKSLSAGEAAAKARELAELVHVDELLDRRPNQLSGGQQQRVALARALVKEPHLLLLDEPLSNLDATLRLSMRTEIKALQRRLGITTILVTHDQIEATTMADRIVCMSKGRIEQVGSPDDLYLRPASLFVAGFIGAPPINLLAGHVDDGAFRINGACLPINGNASGRAVLGIRPENIAFAETGLGGTVREIEPMGREILYILDTPLGEVRVLEAGTNIRFRHATSVKLAFDSADTLLFDAESERLIDGAGVQPPADQLS